MIFAKHLNKLLDLRCRHECRYCKLPLAGNLKRHAHCQRRHDANFRRAYIKEREEVTREVWAATNIMHRDAQHDPAARFFPSTELLDEWEEGDWWQL